MKNSIAICLFVLLASTTAGFAQDRNAIPVELKKTDSGWQLFRAGKPYQIRGSGGAGNEGPIPLLAELGGNSTRTWGVESNTVALLDEAHANGLSVAMGLWLEHERLGKIEYSNAEQVAAQVELTMSHVKRLKDHPAILVWGVGNEMEGLNGKPEIWEHIENLAKLIKAEDPNHPVMTVIAEMGASKIQDIHEYCPSVDIIGINSYGGGPTVPQRYRGHKGTKPYIVTEFGPLGTWETGKNSIGTLSELTSTAKVESYRNSFEAFRNDKELCLGAYAFLWGAKQEGTATWFGMLTPDGNKTAAVDLMSEYWTGKKPSNLCPRIEKFELIGPDVVDQGATVRVNIDVNDPEGNAVEVKWSLMAEADSFITNGDKQAAPPKFDDALIKSDNKSAEFKLPSDLGIYRIYAMVSDGSKGGATANVPVRVEKKGESSVTEQSLPHSVFNESTDNPMFAPSGFMGSADAISLNLESTDNPKDGSICMECRYTKNDDWGGVVWQFPADDWGDKPGGLNLSGAKTLTFWARGKAGGEKIKFGFGLLGRDKKFFDTAKDEVEVALGTEWKQFSFDLVGKDLTRIKTGFYWSLAGQGKPLTFYLDRITFE